MDIKSIACADQIGDRSNVVYYCVNEWPVFPTVNPVRTTRREAGGVPGKGPRKTWFSLAELAEIMPLMEKPLLHEEARSLWRLIEF